VDPHQSPETSYPLLFVEPWLNAPEWGGDGDGVDGWQESGMRFGIEFDGALALCRCARIRGGETQSLHHVRLMVAVVHAIRDSGLQRLPFDVSWFHVE
jgi:hypothetical protein